MVKNDNKDEKGKENLSKEETYSSNNRQEIIDKIERINEYIQENNLNSSKPATLTSLKINEFVEKSNLIHPQQTLPKKKNENIKLSDIISKENDLIISKDDYNLLYSLHNIISTRIPKTHKRKKKHIHKKENSQISDKLFFYGYEFIEWIMKSKRNLITRIEANKLAQAMLMLFIISDSILDTDYIKMGKLIPHRMMYFKDDDTCYGVANPINISTHFIFNQFLKKMYSRCKTKVPNPTNLVRIIFSIPISTNGTTNNNHNCSIRSSNPGRGHSINCESCNKLISKSKNKNIDPETAIGITNENFLPTKPIQINSSMISRRKNINNSPDLRIPENNEKNREDPDEFIIDFKEVNNNILNDIGYSSIQTYPIRNKPMFFKRYPSNVLDQNNNNNNNISTQYLESFKKERSNSEPNFNSISRINELENLTNERNELVRLHYTQDDEFEISSASETRVIPILLFLVVLSTSALALQHRYMSVAFEGYPSLIYKIIAGIAGFLWILAFIFVIWASFFKYKFKLSNILWGLNVTIYASVAMSLFQISDLAIALSRTFAKVLFWMAFGIHVISNFVLYFQLISKHIKKEKFSPSPTIIFSGTAFIVMAVPGSSLGYTGFSWAVFGFGLVYCMIIQTILLVIYFNSYRKNIHLPFDSLPTQNIFIGYPSSAVVSIVALTHRMPVFGRYIYVLAFINYLLVIILWILIILHSNPNLNVNFTLSFWGFGFPFISIATASLYYFNYTRFLSTKIMALFLISTSNVTFIILVCLTLYYHKFTVLFRKNK